MGLKVAVYKSNTPTKDGRCWYYSVYKKNKYGVNTKNKSKLFFTKKEAELAQAKFISSKQTQIKYKFIIVANNYFEKKKEHLKESTIYSYLGIYNKHIQDFFEPYYIEKTSAETIEYWKEEMISKKLSVSYMNKAYNILKEIFEFAKLEYNPMHDVENFKEVNDKVIVDETRIRYITFDEFNNFIQNVDDINWKTFFIFLYYTGMRKGEVQALNWNDINFITNEISVNKTLSVKTKNQVFKITNTKNGANRKVKMSKVLINQLLEYKNYMSQYTDFSNDWYVFGGSRFLPQTTIDRKKRFYFSLCDVKEITIHEFRHSHVSLLINEYLKSGQTDATKFFIMVSNRMGHTLEVMQRIYMHLFPTIQNEIVDLLDNL